MVYCSFCKQTKDAKHNWIIYENGIGGIVKKYRACDECAAYMLKEVSRGILGMREDESLQLPLELTKVGCIHTIYLTPNDDIEIVLKLDYSQARRIIEKKIEKESLEKLGK